MDEINHKTLIIKLKTSVKIIGSDYMYHIIIALYDNVRISLFVTTFCKF